jgi:ATP-dependent DNA helicase RecQ
MGLTLSASRWCFEAVSGEWLEWDESTQMLNHCGGGPVKFGRKRALELLRLGTKSPGADFREGQEEAIAHVVESRGRLLVVQRTGWGKSSVYFIAAKLLREAGMGPALLISPLLSLMRNQLEAAERMKVRAVTINSVNESEWDEAEAAIRRNEVDVIVISPERLANDRFRTGVLSRIAAKISMLVIDEAHCISDWGHDFRPHYRMLERTVRNLPPNVRLLGTTATANERVMGDLRNILGPNLEISRGDLNRPSLFLQTLRLSSQEERLAWLAENVPKMSGNGIIYTLTKRDAERVAEWLQHKGIKVKAYSADTGEERITLEQELLENKLKALVATTALGMGFDKPDLAFVIHYQTPGSVVAYYQQVGRAGRALTEAYGVLLSGQEESDINDFFIDSAFPTRDEVQSVLSALEKNPNGLSVPDLLGMANLSQGRIEKTLALLSLESPSPVAKLDSKWQLTAAKLDNGFWERAERLTSLRRAEQKQMQSYVDLNGSHMEFLIRALDGEPGKLAVPKLRPLPTTVSQEAVKEAIAFLRRTSLPMEPRKKWPAGGLHQCNLRGNIPANRQAQSGRALCYWQDAGWGHLVHTGKYRDRRFSDELVDGCVKMVKAWNPKPTPTWVTCIPSLRNPTQVPDFAKRLAKALGLDFRDVLTKTDNRPEQKSMANSTQQARNVDGSLKINSKSLPLPNGPALLVDDLSNSGWTFTIAAWLLQENSSGMVFPLALART